VWIGRPHSVFGCDRRLPFLGRQTQVHTGACGRGADARRGRASALPASRRRCRSGLLGAAHPAAAMGDAERKGRVATTGQRRHLCPEHRAEKWRPVFGVSDAIRRAKQWAWFLNRDRGSSPVSSRPWLALQRCS
jgi:hypothetical protein